METITVESSTRNQFIDITDRVRDVIAKADIRDGLAVVFVPHTTAGVTINEAADPSVVQDMVRKLGELVPPNDRYKHAEGNSDSHIKATLVGSSVTVFINNGAPNLGTWQGIFFCEFDGPRRRRVQVSVIAG